MKNKFEDIKSFEDLSTRLLNWNAFANDNTYDFVGMMHLLEVCLENLGKNALEAELKEAIDCLSDESIEVMRKILQLKN